MKQLNIEVHYNRKLNDWRQDFPEGVAKAKVTIDGIPGKVIAGKSGGWRIVTKFVINGQPVIFKTDCEPTRGVWEDCFKEQTKNEIEFYQKVDGDDTQYFPELLDFGQTTINGKEYWWMIQEFIPLRHDKEPTEEISILLQELSERYDIGDLDCLGIGKRYRGDEGNWGIDNRTGTPVIFDIGVLEED